MFATRSEYAVLEDFDGKPLRNAEVIVRDASNGEKCFGGRFGSIIGHFKTDKSGRLNLQRLKAGDYWITYMDPQKGESFLVSVGDARGPKEPLELQLDHFMNVCYLVDVERNATKPPTGWPKPRRE